MRKEIESAAFLTRKRLVIFKNLILENNDIDVLEYLKNVVKKEHEHLILVLSENGEPPTKKVQKDLFSVFAKSNFNQEFNDLSPAQLSQWIVKRVSQNGGKINQDAVHELSQRLQNDLWKLSGVLAMLSAFKNNEAITKDDVLTFTDARLEDNIFNFTDAIAYNNKEKALKLLHDQFALGINSLQLLAMIARQFKILLQLKTHEETNGFVPDATVAKEIGLHPFVVKKSQPQAQRYSIEELKMIYQELLSIDVQIKTSTATPELLLEKLIAKI